MPTFQSFTPESFEQFIRAIALKVIGPGVTTFGDGPDGGREASFNGKVPYPFPPDTQWEGYGVFQAKFKTTNEGTQKDQRWAIRQAKEELTKWTKSSKRKPKVEYFVFCTNISLTSATGGGKDQLEKLLKQKQFGLKGFAIWDSNQLDSLISIHPEIRRRFCHFFSPGDLLAEYAESIRFGNSQPAETTLSSYIARELSADVDAKLSQAGDRSEDRISLADVFVDLPSDPDPSLEAEEFPLEENGNSLKELLIASCCKLDPLTLEEVNHQQTPSTNTESKRVGRFVFLGGPGSGKSTIGQFLAQIHRAAILDKKPKHRIEEKIKLLIQNIKNTCTENNYHWPARPRYPFRIELNTFAKTLSGRTEPKSNGLSDYIRRLLSRDISITHPQLIDWFRSYPILLVLDGLDEVPASSNRLEVIETIQAFLNEARDVESDLMIVASSRPDGYEGEFDGAEVAHRYLLPLPTSTAMQCAQKYVKAKIAPKDDHRANEAMTILREAVKNPLISKLMHSPLQVTFMVTVVAASGKPSESRWHLFSDYYRTIYERELHKAVPPFDVVLNTRRSDIDTLHHRIGLILQARGESIGGTQSDITLEEFRAIAIDCLRENGLEESDLQSQVNLIVGAANQRLVFLTSKTPGRLSFDVRSLQEYMAAACLTNDDTEIALKRIEKIAHLSYWRNVLMFTAGRFFSESHLRSHRDKIRILCDDMNLKFITTRGLLPGSRLALDIMFNGIANDAVPIHLKGLAKISLELLKTHPVAEDTLCAKLSAVYRQELSQIYRESIKECIGQAETDQAISGWYLLQLLVEKGADWAIALWQNSFPTAPNKQNSIAKALLLINKKNGTRSRPGKLGAHLPHILESLYLKLPLEEAITLSIGIEIPPDTPNSSWLNHFFSLTNNRPAKPFRTYYKDKGVGVTAIVMTLSEEYKTCISAISKVVATAAGRHPSWNCLIKVYEFSQTPSNSTFLSAVEACNIESKPQSILRRILPWPISQAIHEPETLKNTENNPKVNLWKLHENHLQNQGIEIADLLTFNNDSHKLSARGVALWELSFEPRKDEERVLLDQIIQAINKGGSHNHIQKLSDLFTGICEIKGVPESIDPAFIEKNILPRCEKVVASSFVVNFSAEAKVAPAWERFYLALASKPLLPSERLGSRPLAHWCISKGTREEQLHPLLKIAGLCTTHIDVSTMRSLSPVGHSYLPLMEKTQDTQLLASLALLELADSLDRNKIDSRLESFIKILMISIEKEWFTKKALELLQREYANKDACSSVLETISSSMGPKDWSYRGQITSIYSKILETGSSGFDKISVTDLGLPIHSCLKN